MEPFHGGGEMISSVALTQSEFKPPPHRFEAGTPAIAQAIGLGCAAGYLDEIGRQRIFEHDQELALHACSADRGDSGREDFRAARYTCRSGELCARVRSCARCRQHGGSIWPCLARRSSLHSAASAQAGRARDSARKLLLLQYSGGSHPHGGNSPKNPCVLRVNIEELYQEIILDHSKRPRNFGALPDATVSVRGDNPSCGDEVELSAKLTPEAIEALRFTGHGCAICMASASLMTTKMRGKSRPEGKAAIEAFRQMLTAPDPGEPPSELWRSARL